MERKLFCEISPATYRLSLAKNRLARRVKDALGGERFANGHSTELLPVVLYSHKSLIRRKLGDVDPRLQENKAANLALAAAKVDGVVVQPGETFSFWRLVGLPSAKRGYKEGLVIRQGVPDSDIGGGMCQFTNLLHWMVLHTPFKITERHHHNRVDLFPDFGRQIPFGTGTSILYNYLDYRFVNTAAVPVQLRVYTTEEYLCGELRSTEKLPYRYHIEAEGERFVQKEDGVYRQGRVMRVTIDPVTGRHVARECIGENDAKVLYDTAHLQVVEEPQGR